MSVVMSIVIGLVMGIVFGFLLEKSRVFEPGVIVGQMRWKNFLMLKVFLTAVATGALVLAFLNGFGVTKLFVKPFLLEADIIGGLILGAGIALAGACPGTVLAQIGAGYKDSILTLVGGLIGALTFSYLEPILKPLMLTGGPGKISFADLLGTPYWVLAVVFAFVLALVLMALEKGSSWRAEIGKNNDGMMG